MPVRVSRFLCAADPVLDLRTSTKSTLVKSPFSKPSASSSAVACSNNGNGGVGLDCAQTFGSGAKAATSVVKNIAAINGRRRRARMRMNEPDPMAMVGDEQCVSDFWVKGTSCRVVGRMALAASPHKKELGCMPRRLRSNGRW